MTVISKPEDSILDLLKKGEPMSFDEIYRQLSQQKGVSEREVKETIWKLREKDQITPNKQWKMKINA